MHVIKRDGGKQLLNIEQIRKQTIPACEGLENVSYEELELKSEIQFYDGIKTSDIQNILIKTALNLVDVDRPNWTYVAARLKLYDLYHVIKRNYNKAGNGDVYKKISLMDYISSNKHLFSGWVEKYTEEEINYLNNKIVGKRDLLFTYLAIESIINRFLLKDKGKIIELPQHMYMAISMFLFQDEKKDIRLKLVEKLYEASSKLWVVFATPILSNARKKNGGTISCLLNSIPDDLEGIFDKFKEIGIGSKIGSGWGIDISRIRAMNSWIQNYQGVAGGLVPWMKILNDISIGVDQLGTRPGAFAVYVSTWHSDIYDFLDTRRLSGEDRRICRDLFLAIIADDVFMEREENNEYYTLFDPYDVPELTELYGNDFKEKYEGYEKEFELNPEKFNPNTRRIKARDLMKRLVAMYNDEGMPFWFFKDNVNKQHEHPELGIIRSANLCTEVMQPTDENHTAVCNLSSINIARLDEYDLKEVLELTLRYLDNVIDLTVYPSEESKRTQKARRSVGIGYVGEAEYIANKHIVYGSNEHKKWIEQFYSKAKKIIDNYNKKLAKEKGSCSAVPGVRCAYTSAIAPNSNSGIVACTTNNVEPVYNKVWIEENLLGAFKVTAPGINADNFYYYMNPYEVDQMKLIECTAIRQKYIDMGISHNMYFDPSKITGKTIRDTIRHAWRLGLKTLYYLRTKPPRNNDIKEEKIACIGCAN